MDPRVAALTRRFPAVADAVAPLAAALGGDDDAVFAALCDMVAEAGSSGDDSPDADADADADAGADAGPAAAACAARDAELELYAEAFQELDARAGEEVAARLRSEDAAAAAAAAAREPRGRWWQPPAAGGGRGGGRRRGGTGGGRGGRGGGGGARNGNGGNPAAHLTYAGRACVDRIMERFAWADVAVVVRCYEAAAENEALAEELLREECPEVVDIAHDPGKARHGRAHAFDPHARLSPSPQRLDRGARSAASGPGPDAAAPLASPGADGADGAGRRRPRAATARVAEQLRQRDVDELAAGARVDEGARGSEGELSALRNRLKEAASQRDRYQALFIKTRNRQHEQEAMRHAETARRTWDDLLTWIVCSDSSSVDLHFLTADQALEAVDAKLARMRGRPGKLRLITGRGNNSANGAVLRPRIQRHLTAKGITHSLDPTGGVVIAKVTR